MNDTDSRTSFPARIIGGAFAGAVFGLMGEVPFLDSGPPENPRILLVGPMIGSIIVAILSACFGNWQLPPAPRIVAIATLCGAIAGVFAGCALFPIVMVVINPHDTEEKLIAAYIRAGTILGAPIGAVIGSLIGIIIWRVKRTTAPQVK